MSSSQSPQGSAILSHRGSGFASNVKCKDICIDFNANVIVKLKKIDFELHIIPKLSSVCRIQESADNSISSFMEIISLLTITRTR